MTHITLVCVTLFRCTAVYRALADDLSAIEEYSCLFVKELHCGYLVELSLFVERADETVSYRSVYLL